MRESEPHPSTLDEIFRHRNAIFFHQRFAGFESHRAIKGASHRAAYQQPIDFRKQLLDDVERRLTADGCRLVVVETSSRTDYEPTRRFYEARGYTRTATIPAYYAPGDDLVIYTKDLT